MLVIFIKDIDNFVAQLGFSSSGIQILFYIAVAIIFYFIFRMRLKMEKIESDLTVITRILALRSPHNKTSDTVDLDSTNSTK